MKHPTTLQKGDIIVWEKSTDPSLIHCGMYLGDNKVIEAMPGRAVNINFLNGTGRKLLWNIEKWMYPKYVWSLPDTQRNMIINNAVNFCLSQRWRRYQYWKIDSTSNWNPNDTSDPYAKQWFCSELVWAGYMNATNGSLNISTAKLKSGSKYEFVTAYSIMNDLDMITYNTTIPR